MFLFSGGRFFKKSLFEGSVDLAQKSNGMLMDMIQEIPDYNLRKDDIRLGLL